MKTRDRNGVEISVLTEVKEAYIEGTGFVEGFIVVDIDTTTEPHLVLLKETDGDAESWVSSDEVEVEVDIRDIAQTRGFQVIETTTEANGYPRNLKFAIVGFEDFKEARELAEEFGLSIESFEKRNGWQLWSRNNRRMYQAYQMSAETFGDDCQEFGKMEEGEFYNLEVNPFLSIFDNFEDLQEFIEKSQNIYEAIEGMEEDEIVIVQEGEVLEVVKQEAMGYEYDTRRYVIGLTQ